MLLAASTACARGAGLASVSRRGYGVAPRVFFTLVFAFAIVAAMSARAAAAFAAALFLIILGCITTIVDATGFASAAEVSDSERRCLSANDRLVQGQRLLPFHQDEIDWLGSVLEMRSDKPRE